MTKRIAAGQGNHGSVRIGNAAQIFTGTLIPDGADAVMMQEDVQRIEGATIAPRKVSSCAHVGLTEEDMLHRTTLLRLNASV